MEAKQQKIISVQPEWCRALTLQQQSVLFLAARGPDGIAKFHPCKEVVRAYRGTVLVAAKFNRLLRFGEHADTFMSLAKFGDPGVWYSTVREYFKHADDLPHHYYMHLMHGAEILGYKHPDDRFRNGWHSFYRQACIELHLNLETEDEMDFRLSDWGREHWDQPQGEGK